MNERKDASDFLRWLVNTLRTGLYDKDHSMETCMIISYSSIEVTVIDRCFKGKIEIVSKKFKLVGILSYTIMIYLFYFILFYSNRIGGNKETIS